MYEKKGGKVSHDQHLTGMPRGNNKGRVQMRRDELWVCSSAWCEKGIIRRLPKKRVGGETEERACVHSFRPNP